jgi:hypothetical protein
MDLQKFWENVRGVSKRASRDASAQASTAGERFLFELSGVLSQDLKLMTRCSPPDEAFTFSGLKVLSGSYEIEGTKSQLEKPTRSVFDYVYLQIPSRPGFLVQMDRAAGLLVLERASKVHPRVLGYTGEQVQQTLFVTQKEPLEVLSVLDEGTVRTAGGKTLSVGQFSEMLLVLAFEELEDSLQEWVRN